MAFERGDLAIILVTSPRRTYTTYSPKSPHANIFELKWQPCVVGSYVSNSTLLPVVVLKISYGPRRKMRSVRTF